MVGFYLFALYGHLRGEGTYRASCKG